MPSDSDVRSRSTSPPRESKNPKSSSKGFKWKEKRPREEDTEPRNEGRLERGYRDRSPRRDSYRDRDREYDRRKMRGRDDDEERDDKPRFRDRSPRRQREGGIDSYRPGRERDEASSEKKNKDKPAKEKEKREKKEKKPRLDNSEPMIVVNVNDRLGTKAGIPCLASDSVKAFKAMVAAHIGRQPHEIMLKRQGERPFKDHLTLADYGVSNGVQLDLELDTGD